MVGPEAKLLREVSAPVWPPYARSPRAAGYSAFCGIGICVGGSADACSDCANVVKQYFLSLDVCQSPKRVYSGLMLQGLSPGKGELRPLAKVAAHLGPEEDGLPPGE
eukprot:7933294-Pyramimonas_sp.AAC.1